MRTNYEIRSYKKLPDSSVVIFHPTQHFVDRADLNNLPTEKTGGLTWNSLRFVGDSPINLYMWQTFH